jgi:group II intron reverse transcriptase/maturase
MSQKALERLEILRKLNSNKEWVNHGLYRLMYEEDLYKIAYERIKSKPGNMTPGTDRKTLDGFSLQEIQHIIHLMRTEHFHFHPVQTTFIPKANGKMRKLGMPSTRDKIVQEVIHMILEAIYDSPYGAYFRPTSHGFRPHRSCHTALKEIRENWSATNWLVEGDVQACFDDISHQILVDILRKKITDERFISLIWKLLKAGYLNTRGERKDSLAGTPQGGIASPILSNVYLHELDMFVEGLQATREKGKMKKPNPTYRAIVAQRRRLIAKGMTKTKAFRVLSQQMRSLPSQMEHDPGFIRIKYLRYADDWLIAVSGSHALAQEIKQEIKTFLKDHLKLALSEEKTRITHAKTEEAFFLGTTICMGSKGRSKQVTMTNASGRMFKRRSTGWETIMKAPILRLVKRLHERGFCTPLGEPTAKYGWAYLDVDQIISLYSSVNRGIQNYYRFADNWKHLSRIQYILEFSLAKTLACKYNTTLSHVFKRYGKPIHTTLIGSGGKERTVTFYLNHDWGKNRDAFHEETPAIDLVQSNAWLRTRSKLGKACCICNETGQTVMHHVRHVRKLSDKREPRGFNRILRALNRKQIPVCTKCHGKIHRGDYDGLKLKDFAYIPS